MKKGDKVRVLIDCLSGRIKKGDVLEFDKIEDDIYRFKIDKNEYVWLLVYQFEPIKDRHINLLFLFQILSGVVFFICLFLLKVNIIAYYITQYPINVPLLLTILLSGYVYFFLNSKS